MTETGRSGGSTSFGENLTARGGAGAAYDPRRVFADESANVQVFPADGWWDKPDRADTVDMLVVGAGAGGSSDGRDGENGQLMHRAFSADELPDRVRVEVGKGGRGGTDGEIRGGDGANGIVVVTTHLKPVTSAPDPERTGA